MKRQIIRLLIFALALIVNGLTADAAVRGGVSISGKLLQANGKPLGYTEIELVPIDSAKQINDRRLLAATSVSGFFLFSNVPAGKYTLSINFDEKPSETSPYTTFFYPNAADRAEAEVFDVNAASEINGLMFRLPSKLVQRKITGRVNGTNGAPSAGAFVYLRDIEYDDSSFAFVNKTDRNGDFRLNGFENRIYYITAILLAPPPSDDLSITEPLAFAKTDRFTLNADNTSFTLRLRNISGRRDLLDKNVGLLILDY